MSQNPASPISLSPRQRRAVRALTDAAYRLSRLGVSLVWDDEHGQLTAVNRLAMSDGCFFPLGADQDRPRGALPLTCSEQGVPLDITVTRPEEGVELFYKPKDFSQ